MDIPALSMSMSMYQLGSSWSMGLMSKVMDSAEENMEAMVEMMEAVSSPDLGQHIDRRV